MRFTRMSLMLCLVCLLAPFRASVFAQTQQTPRAAAEAAPPGWQRREVGDRDGRVSVLLPKEPQDLGVASLKRPDGQPLPTHVYITSAEARIYSILIVDLPQDASKMTDDDRGEVFYGCWRAVANRTSVALEQRFGKPFEITSSAQKVGDLQGYERRAQDFKVGDQNGRAQVVFAGARAYMLVSVWGNSPESETDALRFLNSFQVKRELK